MEITKGKVYYIKGCTEAYQLKNIIVANFIELREYVLMIDGENVVTYGMVASEDGNVWYPQTTLTDILGD